MNPSPRILLFATLLMLSAMGQDDAPRYAMDFQSAQVDTVPDDFLVLDGRFGVKEEAGNKFLELPGAPLDTFGVLFGPSEKEGVAVTARIFGSAKGRRYPAFAVSLNGVGGFRLQVSPAKRAVELYKGDEVKATAAYTWTSDQWTRLKLQVHKSGDKAWTVEGKVWADGSPEPADWAISIVETEEPPPGKAAVWGNPFSGTPLRFDDFKVLNATSKS